MRSQSNILEICFMIYALPTALFLTVAMVFILRPLAQSVGLVDIPSTRKQHVDAVPLIGGVAIYAALLVSALIFPFWKSFNGIWLVLLGFPILLVGIADDRRHVSVPLRFLVETGCCLIAAGYFDVRLLSLGELLPDMNATLGSMSVPVTIFGMVGVMNAFNMVDGADGLSGGLAVLTFSSLAALAAFSDNALALQLFTVTAALLGFLFFNFRFPGRSNASIFMGDAGTMLVGFLLGWYMVLLSQGDKALITPVAALWFFALPLMDTVTVMFRRLLSGRSPFKPDREHLHHILQASGASVNQAVLKILGLQFLCIVYALTSIIFTIPMWISFWLFMTSFITYYFLIDLSSKKSYFVRKIHMR